MPANTPRGYTYPLYTDANNFPAQIQDFATDVDTDVQAQVALANTALVNPPSARVSATANQSIAVNTQTLATFATEDYDNGAMANLGVNNERLTLVTTGVYLVGASVRFVANGNATIGGRQVALELGGVIQNRKDNRVGFQTGEDTRVTVTALVHATAPNMALRVFVIHNSGAAVNISQRNLWATKIVIP